MVTRNEHASRSDCPIACALDLVGDHWTLVIIRDLLFMGRHEFREFLAGEEGISTNILSQRLRKLQDNGLVAWVPHPQDRKRKLYYLTASGKDMIHVLIALSHWSAKHLPGDPGVPEPVRQLAAANPRDFVGEVFRRLAEWEAEQGITAAD